MARLPQPGGDPGNWGQILNEYLLTDHDTNGHLKAGVVGSSQIVDAAVGGSKIAGNAITTSHVADGALPQAKVIGVTADIAAKYTKPGTGIAKTDLEIAVQNSLSLADTALQTVPVQSGVASLSGFPLRLNGDRQISYPIELGKAHISAANPTGLKRVILAESWNTPGVLKHIWVASSDGDATMAGFAEDGGTIRIYVDDATTPVVNMTLNDFFAYSPLAGEFSNRRIGRTKRGGGESSAYRYVHMPFKKYLRVEVENTSSNDVIFFGSADYSLINDYANLGTQQLNYKVLGVQNLAAAQYQQLTVVDIDGNGQLESIWLALNAASGDTGILEGNIEIFVDNETYPSWRSSGTEDAFNGGWYNVPVGGFPAGRAGDSTLSGTNASFYRFFIDDPIYFSTHIKINIHAGQHNQGTITSSTVSLSAFAGIWTNTSQTIGYTAVDTVASPILNDQFTYAAGALNGATWNQDGSRTQAQSTGSSITFAYDGASAGQDTRAARKGVTLPANYWVETRGRITDSSHDGQEMSLIAKGASPDPYFGSAVHVQLVRFGQYNWVIRVRDDFDEVFVRTVFGGRDMTNVWVKLALKVVGTTVTAYWCPDSSTTWQPIGSWTSGKTGDAFGVGTWTAGAEFDYLVVRPLLLTTS